MKRLFCTIVLCLYSASASAGVIDALLPSAWAMDLRMMYPIYFKKSAVCYENLTTSSEGPFTGDNPWRFRNNSGSASVVGNTITLATSADDLDQRGASMTMTGGTRYVVGVDASNAGDGVLWGRFFDSSLNSLETVYFFPKAKSGIQYFPVTPVDSGNAWVYFANASNPGSLTFDFNKFHVTEDVTPTNHGKIVCIGDSLTSIGLDAMLTKAYPTSTIIGAGVGGNTLAQMAARYDTDVAAESPDKVIIWGGVNDIAAASSSPISAMQTNLQSMVNKAGAAGDTVILVNISPWKDSAAWTTQRQTWTEEWNTWLASYASSGGHLHVDMYSYLDAGDDTMVEGIDQADNIHIDENGYASILPAFETVLKREWPENYITTTTEAVVCAE